MFFVYSIKDQKIEQNQKKSLKKEQNLDFFSQNKIEEKQNLPNYNLSIQTNSSSYSSKGGFSTSFFSEQYISDDIQEMQNKNKFIGKKRKYFKIINKEGGHNLNENKALKELKKLKNYNNNNLVENIDVNEGRWNNEENYRFLKAIYNYGNDWKEVKRYIGTRTTNQVRSHAQKFIMKLKTFKDSEIGIDFTLKEIKKPSDIVDVIKKSEINNKNDNLLLLLNQKLSEKIIKNSGNLNIFNITNEANDIIKNSYINNIENGDNTIKSNIKEKENNNINSENINNDAIENQNKTNKNEELNEIKFENDSEKKEIKYEMKNEKGKKEIPEEDNCYFDCSNSCCLDNNNKYIIIDGIAFENNKDNFLTLKNQNIKSKELATISIINGKYFS